MNTHDILMELVSGLRCKPGWVFSIVEEPGTEMIVQLKSPNNRVHVTPMVKRHERRAHADCGDVLTTPYEE